jgi:DNA-binding response OmpR family regulator
MRVLAATRSPLSTSALVSTTIARNAERSPSFEIEAASAELKTVGASAVSMTPQRRRAEQTEQGLKDAAYAVDWVTDGEAAVDAVQAETYDLTLLDLGLPLSDGLTVLQRFRNRQRQLPVIIVTARDGVDDRVDGLDLGADDYLTKPFEVRELLARMRAILRRQGSGISPILSNGVVSLDPATHDASFGEGDLQPDCARVRTSTGLVDRTGHYLVARRPRATHLRLE